MVSCLLSNNRTIPHCDVVSASCTLGVRVLDKLLLFGGLLDRINVHRLLCQDQWHLLSSSA